MVRALPLAFLALAACAGELLPPPDEGDGAPTALLAAALAVGAAAVVGLVLVVRR